MANIDLTTLPGWSALSPDSYSITIVAKADGYRDSEPSEAVIVTKAPQEYTDCITFTGETDDFDLYAMNKEWDGTVEYSTDHETWTEWDGSYISSVDKKLYLRGSGNTTFYTDGGAQLSLSERAACSGNIQTLLEYSNPPTSIPANYCYFSMFQYCTNLTQAPALPATTLAESCYSNMFAGCTSLTTAPELPATTLANDCYSSMFYGCTSLTTAPALPATTLAESCYWDMFDGCTSLTTAPELPATTLANDCYSSMFYGCRALKISATQSSKYPTAWRIPSSGTISSTATSWNSNMLSGTGGTFTSGPSINTTYYGAWSLTDCITFTGESSDFTLKATYKEWDGTVEYSTDHNTWTTWDGSEISSSGQKLYLRGSGNTQFYRTYGARFVLSARAACSGNIQTLLEYSNPPTSITANNCYYSMFRGCTSLTTAPALPATTLADYCYASMFRGCTSLTTAPELPATTLANSCYDSMFNSCTGLTQAPELPATTLASGCYGYMFEECTSLTQAPALPATTLASYCYQYMFYGCRALKISATQSSKYPTAWRIPSSGTISSTATSWNSNMLSGTGGTFTSGPSINTTYYGAWSLTDCITFTGESSDFTLAVGSGGAKEWDGTVEYSTDHNTWTTWNGTAISSVDKKLYLRGSGNTKFYTSNGARLQLSARAACSGNIQTLLEYSDPLTNIPASNCYRNMFNGCTNLTQAPELPATTLANSCYGAMFMSCTSLTQAPELPATTLANSCYDSMFNSCTGLTQAPELPATTLANHCYMGMFYGCTSLTTAPALPVTTLADSCYMNMFNGCTNLTQAPALPATTLADYCYMGMFYGCTSLTQAPELPATTLASYCYYAMFQNCTSLKISATQSSEYLTAWRIPSSGTISSTATNWNYDMLNGTGGTFTSNPSINTTYYGAWESSTPTLISFAIAGTSYQAEEGMTWEEWVNSSYNTDGYANLLDAIRNSNGHPVVYTDGGLDQVDASEAIIANNVYYLSIEK